MTPRCALCEAEDASEEFRVGLRCARRLGLRMLPPPRRPAVPCTRCNGMVFVRVLPRVYGVTAHATATGVPMTLTAKPPPVQKYLLGSTVGDPQLFYGVGTVETFVCRSCGFVEWYCQDPEAIPIGDEYNTQLVDYSTPGPYR